jgi:hypothetical protein
MVLKNHFATRGLPALAFVPTELPSVILLPLPLFSYTAPLLSLTKHPLA